MQFLLESILPAAQITIAVLLIAAIIVQQRGAGLSSVFGGYEDAAFHKRRGFERIVFISTVVLSTAFLLVALLSLILK